MRFASSLLLCGLMCHVLAAAGPEVTPLPAPEPGSWKEMPVAANELVVFGAAPASTWDFLDDGFKGRVFEGGKVAAFVFPEGRHKVIVTGPDGGRTRIVFVAGGVPPEPKPIDSLVKELAALYAGEPAATRLKDMQSLSALYALMVEESANPSYLTAAQLNARFIEARDSMLSDPKKKDGPRLLPVRKRCGVEVQAAIGDIADAPLTDASRKAVAAVYAKLAQAVLDATR